MLMDKVFTDFLQCTVVDVSQKDTIKSVGGLPFLPENRIHIWSVRYEDLDWHYKVLSQVLSSEEWHTASMFRRATDAKKYLLRHGVVRSILGHYIHQDPEMVSLVTGKNGKPELDPQGGYTDVYFNLSHSHERVLIGVNRKHPIGVDIVHMDPSYRFHDTAEYMLTMAEQACIQRIEPDLNYQVFFRIWAIKEALLKATGGTLVLMKTTDLSEIIPDICSSKDCSMNYLNTHTPFFIRLFRSGPGHYGAIAVALPH
jgi:4'-phosphopantetheinyl transferase